MILKRFSVFYILLFLCLSTTIIRAQASLQRGVRISNANGNIVSILTGATTQTYSLTLPLASNPALTTASLLFGTGTGNLGWTDATGAVSGSILVLQNNGGNLIPTWTDPLTLNFWSLSGNPVSTAWNGTTGNFIGTTSNQPLVVATTNTATPQPIEFYTNNAERMRLSETGKLGIGQSNPTQLLEVYNGNFLLSNSGTVGQLQFQGTGTGLTTFQAGAQGTTNINYTLPLSAPLVSGYVLSSTTAGVMNWIDPTTLSSSDWHLLGNVGTTPWNGTTGNFLGTTDAQPTVIATTNTASPQPIEFFTNTTEKMRISASGKLGINQTNPSQLVEVTNGNMLLSNTGTPDQLQFQGTSTGITTFVAGGQGASDLTYTLPIAAPSANSLLYSSGGAVNDLSWS
ncbi:MAG TPA: hypothetical protein VNZ86_11570, partial [Bacteroidia bacterium]|nr:hypothetical protein [Bacteroidia bacterium]